METRKNQPCIPRIFLLSLFLFALDAAAILVGKLTAKKLDKINKESDAEQTCRQRVENTRSDLADIVAVDAETAKEEAEQERCLPVLGFGRNL